MANYGRNAFMTSTENQAELELIAKLGGLKHSYGLDIRDRAGLKAASRAKSQGINRMPLTGCDCQRLFDSMMTPDVCNIAQTLHIINTFGSYEGGR
jgi:type I restriction enzyme R subunit